MAPPVWQLCKEGKLTEVREALVLGEEDVNSKDENNRTGLMWAAMHRHNTIVRLLLEQRTLDLNAANWCGKTGLHHAVFYGNTEAVALLLADPRLNSVNHKDKAGETPVMLALKRPHGDELRLLVDHPTVDLDTMNGSGRSLEGLAR